jgi:transcriptional regulator with XRE-family HTH domain
MQIGKKIKELRRQKELTLQQLSEMSGVSIGLLSQIERDVSSSTIHKLQKIVKALDTSIASLFDESHSPPPDSENQPLRSTSSKIDIVRAADRKKLLLPFGGILELLAPIHNHKMEFIQVRHPVGTRVKEPFHHEGEECGLVIQGRLKVTIGDEEFILEEGDSIYFDSTIPHSWENVGDIEVKFVSALTPPSL